MKKGEEIRVRNKNILGKTIKESLTSVLPITIIVLLLCFTIAPMPMGAVLAFIVGAAMLIIGMGLFNLGAEMAMSPLGERAGVAITKSKKLWLLIGISFILGIIITISEPDLQVLANQVPSIPNQVLIWTVAIGVGLFLVIAMLRILFSVPMTYLLMGVYTLVFILSAFVPADFVAVAFDSGGVTTGPMTVPFIMALGIGAASIRSDKQAGNDSFGLVALCSVGPILAVLILGLVYDAQGSSAIMDLRVLELKRSTQLSSLFLHEIPIYFKEMALALAPIIGFFALFQISSFRMHKTQTVRTCIGFLYTYLGLVLFLTGVNVGFLPVGNYLGQVLAGLKYPWVIIPIAMLIGYFIVSAEPAVHVLNKQVESITAGAISQRAMNISLSVGVCCSLGLAMVRVLTGISIFWFLIPGYFTALLLSFFVPKIFTSIAFDSGGVASGPMTATFLLPFAMGASEALGGNVATDAFGVVAMVAMTPLITIQILGLFYKIKSKHSNSQAQGLLMDEEEIIDV